MKKIHKFIAIFLIMIDLVSCDTKEIVEKNIETDQVTTEQEDKNNATTTQKVENVKNEKGAIGKADDNSKANNVDLSGLREKYLNKLTSIEQYVDNDLGKLYSGTNQEMKAAAGKEYEKWDAALNEIYGVLKTKLPKDEMDKLEKEEYEWIKQKEKDAQLASGANSGGSNESFAYISSIVKNTKERCYYLVNEYME